MRLRQQKTPKGSAIADVGQIRALASSIRQDIVDTVAATGPCSVADVARTLGRPADAANTYQRYLTDPATGPERIAEVKEVLLRLDEQLTILTIRVYPTSRFRAE